LTIWRRQPHFLAQEMALIEYSLNIHHISECLNCLCMSSVTLGFIAGILQNMPRSIPFIFFSSNYPLIRRCICLEGAIK
jgi:hypothetical protein